LTESDARAAGFSAAAVQIRHRTRAALAPGSAPIDVSLVFETARGRLLGAQLFGGTGTVYRADVLIPMIGAGMTVADLYESDLIYAPAFSPRLDPLLVAAKKAVDFLKFPRENR
jgi:NADPH-dependent 2,4-dienoyl-CoA reductase/sulfur reductase-like enzyme